MKDQSKLKKNWYISVKSEEQFTEYEKILAELGYPIAGPDPDPFPQIQDCLIYAGDDYWKDITGRKVKLEKFDNIESFLVWHFEE